MKKNRPGVVVTALCHANHVDHVQQIMFREFTELIYGTDSPYARSQTYASVDAVTGAVVSFARCTKGSRRRLIPSAARERR